MDDKRVRVWRVLVNNSGESNMTAVVGRYFTKSAAMRVAEAFRHEVYSDPYNYHDNVDCKLDENGHCKTVVTYSADARVTIDEDTSCMSTERIMLAACHGQKVEVLK